MLEGCSDSLITRLFEDADRDEVSRLLDACMGRGYWDLGAPQAGRCRIATLDRVVVGVALASLLSSLPEAPGLNPPVGLIRLVATDSAMRKRGIASRLVREVCDECRRLGADDFAACAWVHGRTRTAPLAGVLRRVGFTWEVRIESLPDHRRSHAGPAEGSVRQDHHRVR